MEISDILRKEPGVRSNKIVEKIWGREHFIVFRDGLVGKIMDLKENYGSSLHAHLKEKFESFYMLSGKMLVRLVDTSSGASKWMIMKPGDILDIEMGMPHQFIGLEDSRFVEFAICKGGGTGELDSYRFSQSREYSTEELLELLKLAE